MEPTGEALRIDVITNESQLGSMRDAWTELLRDSSANTLFLTWEWISTWWSVYGGGAQLYILAARDRDDRLIGLAPLKQTPHSFCGVPIGNLVEFIGFGGDVTPEYLDFIIRCGWEEVVVTAFSRQLQSDRTTVGIDLRPFSGQSSTCARLLQTIDGDTPRIRFTRDSVAPLLPLPATTGEFLAQQSRNYRKKLREYENRCERELAAQVRLTATADDLVGDMGALISLHRLRWRDDSRAFRSLRYITFHQRFAALMLERGYLRLFSLETGDLRLASLYCFAYDRRYYFYQSGRNPSFSRYRVGLVLMHRAILHAIGDGATMFDFLRGGEEYKYRWATGEAHNMRFTCVQSPGGHLVTGLRTMGPWSAPALTERLATLVGSLARGA